MKRLFQSFLPVLLMISFVQYSSAQDDVYYDPDKDRANQNTYQDYDTMEQTPVDKTDGYSTGGNSAASYDSADYSETYSDKGNTYITNNYYYDDYNDYYYTTRLRRYYTPNWGVNYYSYWFTPVFYFGWGSWGTSYVVNYSPWYYDPWWGWNNCSYYNSWYDPWWGSNYCTYNSWGWNNWGYGGRYCGGNGWGGYNNGYLNGYYDGYYSGYYDGWNSNYGYGNYNGYYYNGPRRHRSTIGGQTNGVIPANLPEKRELNTGGKPGYEMEIPKEGIQKPINTAQPVQQNVPVERKPGEVKPVTSYDEKGKVTIGRPQETPKTAPTEKGVTPQIRENTTVTPPTQQNPSVIKPEIKTDMKQPAVVPQQRRDGYTPPTYDNPNERRETPERYKPEPQKPTQPNNDNRYNQNNNRQPVQPQQPGYKQPRQERVAPQNPQPRNLEQPRPAQPRMNTTPQQQPNQPRMNITPQQRSTQPRSYQPSQMQPRNLEPTRSVSRQQRSINPIGAPHTGTTQKGF